MDSPTGFSQTRPQKNNVSPDFTIEALPSVVSPYFLNPVQKINKISVVSEKPPHTLFFHYKENSFF